MSYTKFVVILILVTSTIGCASAPPATTKEIVPTVATQSNVNDPKGNPLIANGTATVVVRETATETERTYQSAMSREQAKLEIELARLQAEVEVARAKAHASAEKAKARAANPCGSWFMAPSYCYGYSNLYGGGYYGGSGGVNRISGSGSAYRAPAPPRGSAGGNKNFGGGNSGSTGGTSGGNTGGGSNTGGAH